MSPHPYVHDPSPLSALPPRRAESHKGDFGRGLLIGGSIGMCGSISLAGMAALRSGSGLVRVAVPQTSHVIVAGFNPAYMVFPLPAAEDGSIAADAREPIAALAESASALGCGPGMTTSQGVVDVVTWLYETFAGPAVFDADALNVLALCHPVIGRPAGPRILTPHPGEFGRLLGSGKAYSAGEREALAASFARDQGVILVLKGHQTVVSDGRRVYINSTGNPGMATGGTGDVLTGILVALLCQGMEPYQAARLGVYLHGLAGDLGAAHFGQISLTAADLLDFLPAAFKHHQEKSDPLGLI